MTWAVQQRGQVASTMQEARLLADQGAPEGTTVVAEAQTEARGRRGRTWLAPPGGGVWMTTLLRPPPGPGLQALALVAGMAVWHTVRQMAPAAAVRIKWPNDIWVQERKLAGILLEADDLASPHPVILVGIGLNILPAHALGLPAAVAAHSVGLAELCPCTPASALALLLPALESGYQAWRRHGLAPTLQQWPAADALAQRAVRAEGPQGALHGVACGLGPQGELLLRNAAGETTGVQAGEVQTLRPAEFFCEEPPPTLPV